MGIGKAPSIGVADTDLTPVKKNNKTISYKKKQRKQSFLWPGTILMGFTMQARSTHAMRHSGSIKMTDA